MYIHILTVYPACLTVYPACLTDVHLYTEGKTNKITEMKSHSMAGDSSTPRFWTCSNDTTTNTIQSIWLSWRMNATMTYTNQLSTNQLTTNLENLDMM